MTVDSVQLTYKGRVLTPSHFSMTPKKRPEAGKNTPPYIAPKRPMTADDLKKKGFGEALFSKLTPAQRQGALMMKDFEEMDVMIARREEAMAAETLLTNGCIMRHIADDKAESEEMSIQFYEGANNPAQFTPDVDWDEANADILGDIYAVCELLAAKGLGHTDLIVAPDVGSAILDNEKIQKLLDNRRIEIGNVEPELLPDGAAIVARLNVLGRIISVISYDLTYTDDEGNDKLYIPSGKCVLTAPGAGRTAYGAVSQVEQSDGEFHTYAGRRVPKYVSSAEGNSRTLTISSRPLMIPNNKNPFIVADVLTD